MSSYTNNPHAITTQPPLIEDMIAHVHRAPEFSVYGNGEDVSVFWEPDSTATNPFVTHSESLTDTFLPKGLPFKLLGMIGRTKSERMVSVALMGDFAVLMA
jgi:hypothetical protein